MASRGGAGAEAVVVVMASWVVVAEVERRWRPGGGQQAATEGF